MEHRHVWALNRNQRGCCIHDQPSSLALNLCECSEWSHGGNRSAVHTGWTWACLALRWPTGCEVLWKEMFYSNKIDTRNQCNHFRATFPLLTTEVQNDLYVSVKGMLLCQSDVGGRGTLCTGVCICPQRVSWALQPYKEVYSEVTLLFTLLVFWPSYTGLLYQRAGRLLWPAAESWARKVPGWQLDGWRWRGHTAVRSRGLCPVFLRWHRSSWLLWGVEWWEWFQKRQVKVKPQTVIP